MRAFNIRAQRFLKKELQILKYNYGQVPTARSLKKRASSFILRCILGFSCSCAENPWRTRRSSARVPSLYRCFILPFPFCCFFFFLLFSIHRCILPMFASLQSIPFHRFFLKTFSLHFPLPLLSRISSLQPNFPNRPAYAS